MIEELIAPCGMNCAICSNYLARQHDVKSQGIIIPYCSGCRPRNKQCAYIRKSCDWLREGKVQYCYECGDFPCAHLQHLDKRYRTNFRMSMIENLNVIGDKGIGQLLAAQEQKWKCPTCGGTVCCHNGLCFDCELEKLRKIGNVHRWEGDSQLMLIDRLSPLPLATPLASARRSSLRRCWTGKSTPSAVRWSSARRASWNGRWRC